VLADQTKQIVKKPDDDVRSTSYVPFRHVIAFLAVMSETIKPYLADKTILLKKKGIEPGASQFKYS